MADRIPITENMHLTKKQTYQVVKDNPDLFIKIKKGTKKRFMKYLASNYHIYTEFEKRALDLRHNGKREYYGAFAIINQIRWESYFEETNSLYKVNHDFAPAMARLVMACHPSMAGMFRIKDTR